MRQEEPAQHTHDVDEAVVGELLTMVAKSVLHHPRIESVAIRLALIGWPCGRQHIYLPAGGN